MNERKNLYSGSKIHTPQTLTEMISAERVQGRKIVLTNGCFDLLHKGHIIFLEGAKQQGDFLIVAINSDESVQRFKGPTRPINTLEDRMAVLAAVAAVDAVMPFDEDTGAAVLEIIRPNVYVKGADYSLERVKTSEEGMLAEKYGIKIYLVPVEEGHPTTTSLISKVIEVHGKLNQE